MALFYLIGIGFAHPLRCRGRYRVHLQKLVACSKILGGP